MLASSRVTINTGILYIQMGITVFISLYTTRLILDALGASDFGIFSVVASTIAMMGFLNAAMSSATQRFMSYAQGEGKDVKQVQIFNVSVVLHFLIGLLVILIMEGAGYFLFNGILEIPADRMNVAKLIFHFTVVSTWFNILSVPYNAVLNAHENMLFMAVLDTIEKVLRLAIAIYITFSPYGYDKLAAFGFLVALISLILLVIRHAYCSRKYSEVKYGFRKYYNKALFKEMTGFASWSFLSSSTSMMSNYGQGIVLNMFFGTVVNAAQGIANDISGKLGSFSNTMRRALKPVIDKSEGAGDRNKMLKSVVLGGKMSFFLLILFAIPAIIEMPYILNLWLKDVPQYAIIFCQLLLVRDLVDQLFITLDSSISAVGNIREFKIVESVLHPLPLILSFILFSFDFPPFWIYIIFLIYSIVKAINRTYFANRVADLSIFWFLKGTVLRSIICLAITLLFALVPLFFFDEGFIRLLLVGLFNGAFLLLTVWYFGLENNEQAIFKRLFGELKKNGFASIKENSAN